MPDAEYWAAEYDAQRCDDGVHPRRLTAAEFEAHLEALAAAQNNLRAHSMIYQADLKAAVAAHYGLSFAEVDLPYAQWAALRDRYNADLLASETQRQAETGTYTCKDCGRPLPYNQPWCDECDFERTLQETAR